MTAVAPIGWFGPIPLIGSAKQIAVTANIDGHLELFFIDTKNHLGHSFQTQVNGIFWAPLAQLSTRTISQIAAIQNIDGRLEVFYTDSKGNLWHNFQTKPQTIADQTTLKLPWFAEQTLANIKAKQFAVALNKDGRLELFYIDQNNNLTHIFQTVVPKLTPNTWNQWSAPTQFGVTAKTITAGRNSDGRLEIFFTGTDKTLYHDWQTTPATLPNDTVPPSPNNPVRWNGATTLGKKIKAQQVAIGQNKDGRLEAFYVGDNNDLYHVYQTQVITPPVTESASLWSAQSRISKISAKQVTAVADQAGILYALYVGLKNKADIAHQLKAPIVAQPQTLNQWNSGGSFPQSAKQIVAANNADGRPEFFCVGTNNQLTHFWTTANLDRTASNQNVVMSGSSNTAPGVCPNLINVVVAITITNDLVVDWTTGPTKGFGVQLNAFSAPGFKCIFQQYAFSLEGAQIIAWVNNYGANGSLIDSWYDMKAKFKNFTIPAGTQFQISLFNDGATGNVNEFSVTVFNGSAVQIATFDKKLKSTKGGSAKNLAPITAFEVDIVGPVNGAGTVFSPSGLGTIQYSADNQLFTSDVIPGCSGGQGQYTEEISNARYAAIPGNQRFAFQQNFFVAATANP